MAKRETKQVTEG